MEQKVISEAVALLKQLIATPSVSREEQSSADIIFNFIHSKGLNPKRKWNNVWVKSSEFDSARPTLLLNSHHDTVKPVASYTRDPLEPVQEGDKIYGLGSNDAGGSVVALIEAFLQIYDTPLPYNIVLALTAEEECMGEHGMRGVLSEFGKIDMAIVGEPTQMRGAVGERGLVVLDCVVRGVSGHAARSEGENAIYKAIKDIELLRNFKFNKVSDLLGEVTITTTQITAGTQHNVVPDECRFVVDIRTTDAHSNEEVVEILRSQLQSEATPRSTRVRASVISEQHPLIQAIKSLNIETFVSPTTSDMALMPFPSLKIGVGESARSHKADEFVHESEIKHGIEIYLDILSALADTIKQHNNEC